MSDEESLQAQAARLEAILPQVMRNLFTLGADHPVNELPLAQLRLCSLLQTGPHSMSMVSRELSVTSSAATQLADRLEAAGLIERIADPTDRRSRSLRLTPVGSELMRSRREGRVRGVAKALARLSPEQREQVMVAMQDLLEAGRARFGKGEAGPRLHAPSEDARLETR